MTPLPHTILNIRYRVMVAMLLLGLCTMLINPLHAQPVPGLNPILWSADTETGDLSQWTRNDGGGVFNTGSGAVTVTDEVAHSGRYAVALAISTDQPDELKSDQAARLFRWNENPKEAYYSAWFYFDDTYNPKLFWNIFQFKSKSVTGEVEPTLVLNVDHTQNGEMILYLWNALQQKTYERQRTIRPLPIPVREWFQLEVYYKRAVDNTGRISVWQNGALIFDIWHIQTAIADNVQWSVNNYSNGLDPEHPIIYVDDAVISLFPVGSQFLTGGSIGK